MKPLFASIGLFAASFSVAEAAIQLTVSGTVSNADGLVSAGLNGATFTVTTVFNQPTYQSYFLGSPAAIGEISLTSLVISGASNASFNGTYSLFAGSEAPVYDPRFAGLYDRGTVDGYNLFFDLGGDRYIGAEFMTVATATGAGVNVGDQIQLSHFSNGPINDTQINGETTFTYWEGDTLEGSLNVTGTFSAVPEPSSAILGAMGALALLNRRVRRA